MKVKRHTKIIEIISKYDIDTQEELAERLYKAGFRVTQATISRDIRELKLTKVAGNNGKQRYVILESKESDLYAKYVQVLKTGFLSMDQAQNILVIKTVSGMAMAVAAALDELHIRGIVGSIAGDDTVMCAIRDSEEVSRVMVKIKKLIME
ncbi:MAG: arginine repressor [Lachnospiraceae bacterium]|nr:arginine repressor [Lachnospiraceae bacterium]